MNASQWAGKRVTVMGLGRLGGGVGVARFLVQQGAVVTVTDLKGEGDLAESVARLDGLPVTFHLGDHRAEDFADADAVVVNPAVPDGSPFLATARAARVPLTTEINLFFEVCPATILGVTGSNGKTTTASLAAHLLEAGPRRVWLGGNIGRCLLEDLEAIGEDDVVVLELSSFQLERLEGTGRSPAVSVVLNVQPDHLDRHPSMAAYARAKQPIVLHQREGDAALLNADCPVVSRWGDLGGGRALFFSVRRRLGQGAWLEGDEARWADGASEGVLFRRGDLRLRGEHNVGNALAAAGAAVLCGVPLEAIAPRLRAFEGLAHRLEFVGEVDRVGYYNDSKATTTEAAVAALRAFDEPVVLIAGGSEKYLPVSALAREVARRRMRGVVLLGATAGQLEGAVGRRCAVPIRRVGSLAEAVAAARALARPGDAVVLSPGTASYDMFANFEERGQTFKRLVGEL
ncbi:MAG: UDP-N-acetylmuramoyl-L-alanine--D-glutamate ligase [bacterium]